jgi:uncharacterized protein with PQ loop repeat
MVHDNTGLHHFHRRKRIHEMHETYPSKHRWKKVMDRIIYIIAFIGPVMTIPQLINIWVDKQTAGVSAISWATYLIVSIFWLIYGILHREKPIIFSSCIWIVLDLLIVVGTLIY